MADPAGIEPAETSPGRRDRNRERLYLAALALFSERGFEATTMDDVAARAGLARRTAFNHFPAKSDFTAEWASRRRAAATASTVGTDPGPDVASRVAAWFRRLAELTEVDPDETEQMTLGWLRAGGPIREPTGTAAALRPWIVEGVRTGALAAGVDPALASEVLFDVYIAVLCRWFAVARDQRDPLAPQVDAAIDLVLRGLVARP